MREMKIYKLNELSPLAREIAIDNHRDWMEENLKYEAMCWATDDCSLFEPKHQEMVDACGEDYYKNNGDQFVFKHMRGFIDWDFDGDEIELSQSLKITNEDMFFAWLGIPKGLRKYVSYVIGGITITQISFESVNLYDSPIEELLEDIFKKASDKFDAHIENTLIRIKENEKAYFEEENVVYSIENIYNLEFFEDGERFTKSKSRA
jgi:hypothetical protein